MASLKGFAQRQRMWASFGVVTLRTDDSHGCKGGLMARLEPKSIYRPYLFSKA